MTKTTEPMSIAEDWVSIIVPTFSRPLGLGRALESLSGQTCEGLSLELIVADNDPDGSAEKAVRRFAQTCSFPVRYIHVAQPGVANARNSALDVAKGRYIAFLDDDQSASEHWLSGLLRAMESTKASIAFTPIEAKSELRLSYLPQRLAFFSRKKDFTETTVITEFFGCGSSMIDRQSCCLPTPAFSLATNETGGEDDLLFAYLQSQGVGIVWAAKVFAYEHVENWRMSLEYIRIRSFAFGQGPSRLCAEPAKFKPFGLLRWMAIGLAQLLVFAPLALISHKLGSPAAVPFMRKACEGAGKFLWMERFRPKIYGATALKEQIKREATLFEATGKSKSKIHIA